MLTLDTEEPTEGAPIEATLAADPAHEDGVSRTTLKLRFDEPRYSLDAASRDGVRIGNDSIPGVSASHTITIEPPDNDGKPAAGHGHAAGIPRDRGKPRRGRRAADSGGRRRRAACRRGGGGRRERAALDPQPESVKEGETIKVKLTSVDEDGNAVPFGEKLSVSLTPAGTADSQDYTLSMHPVDIAADGESATVDLTVRENEEVNAETLVLDAEVAGEAAKGSETRTSSGILSVAIEDTTPRLVRAKSEEDIYAALMAAKDAVMGDHGLNPGEDFELMGSDLFDAAADVTVSYEAESDSESTASVSVVDGTIAVMPTSEGTAHVTVTATATPTASSVEIIEQTEANVARILFPVEVTLEPPTFSMSADDTDIVEGMSGRLTVSASRPVSTDTDVMIVRDGTSSAGADDYRLDPMTVTIEASSMSGHTLVEAVEDGTAEEGEVLTLFAVVDGVQMPDVSVSFRLWDAAVPALQFVAPFLLAAFLAVGGYRRYVRRRLGG